MPVRGGLRHWLDVARLGVRLAREAVDEDAGNRAVAFSLNGDISSSQDLDRLQLLARAFEKDPPDLVLMETMSLIRDGLTVPATRARLQQTHTVLAHQIAAWLGAPGEGPGLRRGWAVVGALHLQLLRWAVYEDLDDGALREALEEVARAALRGLRQGR